MTKNNVLKKSIRWACLIMTGILLIMDVGCKKDQNLTDTPNEKKGYMVIDIAKEASSKAHTFETIQALMDSYAQAGVTEVCFEPIPDTYAATESCQGAVVCDASIQSDHMHRTVHAVFDPNLVFIQAAKKLGMEVTVMYHPYEGGGSVTIPADAKAQFSMASVTGVGGTASFCVGEIAQSKTQLISSIQAENPKLIGKGTTSVLEVVFVDEAVQNRVSQHEIATLTPDAKAEIKPILWCSSGNTNYERVSNPSFEVTTERRQITDANGNDLGEKNCRVLKIDISSYSSSKYYAVAFENGNSLYTLPFSMINIYDKSGSVISTTKAVYTRNPNSDALLNVQKVPNDYIWGAERMPIITTDSTALSTFPAWGFEFQYGGIGSDWGDGWHNAYVYGIATGVQSSLCGNLCEGFESVREYWLGQVDRFYAKGADCVIISLQNCGGMVYNYTDFGYNYTYAKEFKQKYGIDILTEEFDYVKLMEHRGSYFLEFLRSVDQIAEQNQKKWGIELFSSFENPTLDDDLNGLCHYKMPKLVFDWQEAVRLCDTVLIGDYQYGTYDTTTAASIRKFAVEQNKTVAIMAYSECGANTSYLETVWLDSYIHSVFTDSKDVYFATLNGTAK